MWQEDAIFVQSPYAVILRLGEKKDSHLLIFVCLG